MTWKNKLFFGDNLQILPDYIPDESVDLIYLDPPFNSNVNYNVLFEEKTGEQSVAQILVFEDTWQWGEESARTYQEVIRTGPEKVANLLKGFRQFLRQSDMMAYLTMMAPRLVQLHRVLSPKGTLYLHCDPTASHYIKLLLDAIFDPRRFLNEIVWKRSSAHSDTKQGMKRCGKIHDVILVYTKSDEYTWNPQYTPYTLEYLESEYRHVAPDGRRYKETDLTAAKPGGDTEYEWRVKRLRDGSAKWEADLDDEYLTPKAEYEYLGVPPYKGRYWAYSKNNIKQFAKEGHLIHRKTGMPRLVQFSDEMPGVPLQDFWDDIPPTAGTQDLGYPTQKPEALLERIILSSSNKGDIVLDPFCGCGTTVSVAEELERSWVGIDITHLAIALMRHRLHDNFGSELSDYEVIGDPKDLQGARALAEENRYQFQWWAVGIIDGFPAQDKRKGSDRGIDGFINFFDGDDDKAEQLLISVKSGNVSVRDIRDLVGVLDREEAAVGVYLTLQEPTRDMTREAASAGVYHSDVLDKDFMRIQIFTIEQLLQGQRPDYPQVAISTFKRAERKKKMKGQQTPLFVK